MNFASVENIFYCIKYYVVSKIVFLLLLQIRLDRAAILSLRVLVEERSEKQSVESFESLAAGV